MTRDPRAAYDLLRDKVSGGGSAVDEVTIGLTWTFCAAGDGLGWAMSPIGATRVLPWPGTLRGRPAAEVAGWIDDWEPYKACVGLAAVNAIVNRPGNPAMDAAAPVADWDGPGNLAVFHHFRPRLKGKKVVVVGRYPGLDKVLDGLDVTILERYAAGNGDLPDPAAEFILPEADWVFLTASSLVNKTFPRLAHLSRDAVTVLMGPSLPWLEDWADFGIDFLAGVRLRDAETAKRIVREGGGTRLFEEGVRYAVADIGRPRLITLKDEIAATWADRDRLKREMEAWYGEPGQTRRFPAMAELEAVGADLSRLDTRYKRQWDARQG